MKLLSVEVIIQYLKFNFPGKDVTPGNLINPNNDYLTQNEEDLRTGYTCGYEIREFLEENRVSIGLAAKEVLPVVFVVYSLNNMSNFFGHSVSTKGADALKKMGVINFASAAHAYSGLIFYIRTFENMKNGLASYARNEGRLEDRNFKQKFDDQLGSIRPYVDKISSVSRKKYEQAIGRS